MKVALLSLTRDRLWATRHCFATLHKYAGVEFDHFVYDQGSQDGTQAWLTDEYRPHFLHLGGENVGVSKGINFLLDAAREHGPYDVIIKYDNDCELTKPYTVKAACDVALEGEFVVSPHIMGLNAPPAVEREVAVLTPTVDMLTYGRYRVGVTGTIGGIFMAAPGSFYDTYRHDPRNPVWGMDDARLCVEWQRRGGEVGYLLDYPANHYLTTEGQKEWDVIYWERKEREFAA